MLQEHVKTTQTDKTRFFAKKEKIVTRQTIVHQGPFSEQFPATHSHLNQKSEEITLYEIFVSRSC